MRTLRPIFPRPVVHDTMAFSEDGIPLGLVDVQYWAREEKKNRTVAESVKWLESFKATQHLSEQCLGKLIVSVGDRETNFYDLFTAVQPEGAQLLVRAMHCRALVDSEANIWIHMQRCPVAGTLDIRVPARPGRPARTAVLARETNPPKGLDALEWLLLTTVEVHDFETACQRIDWYTRRWGIEIFHRTLKSGCKIEDRQLGSADRLAACLAMLGRETPDVPCSTFFEEDEWKALTAHAERKTVVTAAPPSLYEVLIMIARLGGYMKRQEKAPGKYNRLARSGCSWLDH